MQQLKRKNCTEIIYKKRNLQGRESHSEPGTPLQWSKLVESTSISLFLQLLENLKNARFALGRDRVKQHMHGAKWWIIPLVSPLEIFNKNIFLASRLFILQADYDKEELFISRQCRLWINLGLLGQGMLGEN